MFLAMLLRNFQSRLWTCSLLILLIATWQITIINHTISSRIPLLCGVEVPRVHKNAFRLIFNKRS